MVLYCGGRRGILFKKKSLDEKEQEALDTIYGLSLFSNYVKRSLYVTGCVDLNYIFKEATFKDGLGKYSIFLKKGASDENDEFLSIVKPQVYVEDKDCGIEFLGLQEMNNRYVKAYYEKILENNYFLKTMLEYKRVFNRCRISFIRSDYRKLYSKADRAKKEKLCEYVLKLLRTHKFFSVVTNLVRAKDKFENKDISNFLEKELGMSNVDAVKFMLMNSINKDSITEFSDDKLCYKDEFYALKEGYPFIYNSISMGNNNHFVISYSNLTKAIVKNEKYKERFETYLSNNIGDLWFYCLVTDIINLQILGSDDLKRLYMYTLIDYKWKIKHLSEEYFEVIEDGRI